MFNKNDVSKIRETVESWEATKVKKALEKFPERKETFKNSSEIEVKRLYTPADIEELDYERDLGISAQYPFTRGVQDTMYRGRFWTMRMYAGFATAEESNKRYKYLIEQGSMGLSVAFDLPTQMGYDSSEPSDSPYAIGNTDIMSSIKELTLEETIEKYGEKTIRKIKK